MQAPIPAQTEGERTEGISVCIPANNAWLRFLDVQQDEIMKEHQTQEEISL